MVSSLIEFSLAVTGSTRQQGAMYTHVIEAAVYFLYKLYNTQENFRKLIDKETSNELSEDDGFEHLSVFQHLSQ